MVPYPLFQAEQFTFCFDGAGHGLRHSHGNKSNRHHFGNNCKVKGGVFEGETVFVSFGESAGNLNLILKNLKFILNLFELLLKNLDTFLLGVEDAWDGIGTDS